MSVRAAGLGLLVAFLAPACSKPTAPSDPAPASPSYPEDTVLAVDGIPVPRPEVEELAAVIAERYPANVKLQNLRLAVTNDTLERYAVRARDRERREEALQACREARARIDAGEVPGGTVTMRGNFADFRGDLRLWARARRLEPGTWSEPVELTGRFVLARLDAVERLAPGAGHPRPEDELQLTLLIFPYLDTSYREGLDATTSIREAVDGARLEIVDPAYDEVVPAEWKYRMGAHA